MPLADYQFLHLPKKEQRENARETVNGLLGAIPFDHNPQGRKFWWAIRTLLGGIEFSEEEVVMRGERALEEWARSRSQPASPDLTPDPESRSYAVVGYVNTPYSSELQHDSLGLFRHSGFTLDQAKREAEVEAEAGGRDIHVVKKIGQMVKKEKVVEDWVFETQTS